MDGHMDQPGPSKWGMGDYPRIRSITGIRIHQLTLPPIASSSSYNFDYDPLHDQDDHPGHVSAASGSRPRRRSSISLHPSRKERRISLSEVGTSYRERSGSASTLVPVPIGSSARTTRPRAPTLAGEALEHEREKAEQTAIQGDGSLDVLKHDIQEPGDDTGTGDQRRHLARCFIVMKLPRNASPSPQANGHSTSEQGSDIKGKGKQAEIPLRRHRTLSAINTNGRLARSASSSQISTPTTPTGPNHSGSPHSPSTSFAGIPPRTRTTSLNTAISARPDGQTGNTGEDTAVPLPKLGQRPPRLVRAGSEAARTHPPPRPTSMISRSSYRSPQLNGVNHSADSKPKSPIIPTTASQTSSRDPTPFYISPIHLPSSHPGFPYLSAQSDFANWLNTEELASTVLELEVWYEHLERGWVILENMGGKVDLRQLRRVERDGMLGENVLEFSLKGEEKGWYHLPISEEDGETTDLIIDGGTPKPRRASVRGIMERSVRETRMKKGAGIGSLHQLVHGQMVVADTKQNIEVVKGKIDDLLRQDVDRRALRRDVSERCERIKWIQSKIDEVDKLSREVEAEITLRQKAITNRRENLARAVENDVLTQNDTDHLSDEIQTIESKRSALLPLIHYHRAHHVQTLDALFPIHPLNPSILLYGILSVPLPIPSGKDPAPPLSLPPASLPDGVKVDERSIAAALGYVAMVVQILGNLGGSISGGLVYPITCAGSRSLVKDVVSVMQGPRSFPLYMKGVERYRFDYAVFLLNTNIELLMQEANILTVDRRHTLPNLKALLLTLSSPTPPPPLPTGPRSSLPGSGLTTRTTSRQTSHHWTSGSTAPSSIGPGSPNKAWRGKSHLSRLSWGGSVDDSRIDDLEGDEMDLAGSISQQTSEIDTDV